MADFYAIYAGASQAPGSTVTISGPFGQATMAASIPVVIASDQSPVPVSGTVTATNPSVGTNGAAAPASSTQVAGSDGTNLRAIKVSATGVVSVDGSAVTQPVSAASLPLPTGASTSALQTTGNTSLSSIDTKTPALVSGRVPVDGSGVTQPVSGTVAVSNFPATQPVSGTVAATQSGTWTVQPGNTANTTAWKVDGSAVTQPVSGTVTTSNFPSTVDTNSGVVGASTPRFIEASRLSTVLATYDYSGGSVTTAAYTQVIASTAGAINRLYVFDSSGSAIIIATGAALAEVDKIYLPPGGAPYPYEINIAAGTRISIKALDTTASAGRLIITGLS